MKIIDSHKGCYEYTTYFEGLAGHSSKPDEGVNAAEFATKYINKLLSLRKDLEKRQSKNSIFNPPYSTLSIGGIFGGIFTATEAGVVAVFYAIIVGVFINKTIKFQRCKIS